MQPIERPPLLQGPEWKQLRELHSYLYRLAERLSVLLEESPRQSESEKQTQSPRQQFQSLRSLIAAAEDIQDSFYAAHLPKLQEIFVKLSNFVEFREELRQADAALEEALEAVKTKHRQDTEEIRAHLSNFVEFVQEQGEAEGLSYRLWSSGRGELLGSVSLALAPRTPVQLALPLAISGSAILQGVEAEELRLSDGVLSFTPKLDTPETRSLTLFAFGRLPE